MLVTTMPANLSAWWPPFPLSLSLLLVLCFFPTAPQHIPGWTALEQLAKEDSAIGKLMHLLPKVMLCGHAPSTVQTYARGFNRWHAFASSASLTAFPADGLHVGLYLVHLLLSSSSPAPVATAVASISWVHQKATLPDPTRHACVAQCHRAVQRLLARPVKPKKALVSTEVQRIIEHYSDSSTSLDDLQTITLIVLGFSAMLRWDELHRLTEADRHQLLVRPGEGAKMPGHRRT
eukprot:scpid19765/ scgid10658/ 